MTSSEWAAWLQTGSTVILLLVTFIYTRLNVRALIVQTRPYLVLELQRIERAGEIFLIMCCRNVGRGAAVDIRGEITLRRWRPNSSEDIPIRFIRPVLDAGSGCEIPLPEMPDGAPPNRNEFYRLFEGVSIDLLYADNLQNSLKTRTEYLVADMLT
jgi:hypothetical protein